MKIIITAALMFFATSVYGAYPAMHILAGSVTEQKIETVFKIDQSISKPLAGIGSHIVVDRFFGESGIEYPLELAVTRTAIMFLFVPDDKKADFLQSAFWAMLPDLIDKGFGTSLFHTPSQSNIVKFDNGLTNLFEEFSVLLFAIELQ